jgi:hypothetical protein
MPTKQRFTNHGNQQSHTDIVVQSSTIVKKNPHWFDDLCMSPDILSIQSQIMPSWQYQADQKWNSVEERSSILRCSVYFSTV